MLKGKTKEIELYFNTRNMIKLGEEIGGQYELELAGYNNDLKVLGKVISILSNSLTYDDALDFIDELIENNNTINEIYNQIFNEMNEKAFFTKKLEISEIPPINLDRLKEEMTSKMLADETSKIMQKASKK